jgi:hypothetical protein
MYIIRGDEPIGGVIHVCMETSQGNSLCSSLYLKLAKMSCYSFLSFLLSAKSENRRAEQVLTGQRVGTSGRVAGERKEG